MTARIRHLKEMTWQGVERADREHTVIMAACGPIERSLKLYSCPGYAGFREQVVSPRLRLI